MSIDSDRELKRRFEQARDFLAQSVQSPNLASVEIDTHPRRHPRRNLVAAVTALILATVVAPVSIVIATRMADRSPRVVATATSGHAPSSAVAAIATAWTPIAPGPLAPRTEASSVVTARGEVFIWGGRLEPTNAVYNDGAIVDVNTGLWRTVSPSPLTARFSAAIAWTGKEVLVWGGAKDASDPGAELRDGASYDPTTDRWKVLPPVSLAASIPLASTWTGSEWILVEGHIGRGADAGMLEAASFDPATASWRTLSTPPFRATNVSSVLVDGRLFVLSALLGHSNESLEGNAPRAWTFDLARNQWSELPHPSLSPQGFALVSINGQLLAVDYLLQTSVLDIANLTWDQGKPVAPEPAECTPIAIAGAATILRYCNTNYRLTTNTAIKLPSLPDGASVNAAQVITGDVAFVWGTGLDGTANDGYVLLITQG